MDDSIIPYRLKKIIKVYENNMLDGGKYPNTKTRSCLSVQRITKVGCDNC